MNEHLPSWFAPDEVKVVRRLLQKERKDERKAKRRRMESWQYHRRERMEGGQIRENKISFYRRRIGQTFAAGNSWLRGRDAMHEEWRKRWRCTGREWTRAVIYWLAVLHAGGLNEENQTP